MPAKKGYPKKAAAKKAAPKKKAATKKAAKMKPVAIKEDTKWQAEDDLRTLLRAEEIKADKKRMNNASKIAKQQMNSLAKFT